MADDFTYSDKNLNVTFTVAKDATLTVVPKTVAVTVTGETVTETYDGTTEYEATKVTFSSEDDLFDDEKVVYTAKNATSKDICTDKAAGYVADDFTYSDTNLTVTFTMVKDATLTVVPKTVVVTVTGETVKETYDGTTEYVATEVTFSSEDGLFDASNVIYDAKSAKSTAIRTCPASVLLVAG